MIGFLQKIFSREEAPARFDPEIIQNKEINTTKISKHAITVIENINNSGFKAYLVGGAIRDLLLGMQPKDFDVVTDAHPEQVKGACRNSILIGRRFKLVHVRFGREIIEVATFRAAAKSQSDRQLFGKKGLLIRDNIFGTIDDDVWRRDFTINALYYDISANTITDYTGGYEDLKQRKIKVIGNAVERYTEDPVRMLRAIRYAAKLDFAIESDTSTAIESCKALFTHVSPDRLFVEVMKTFYGGFAIKAYSKLQEYDFFSILFPKLQEVIDGRAKGYKFSEMLIERSLYNTDLRYNNDQSLSSSYLFVVFFWPVLQHNLYKLSKTSMSFGAKVNKAIELTLNSKDNPISLTKNVIDTCTEVWLLQFKLVYREESKINDSYEHPKFRMAYDFLLLRAQVGEEVYSLATWWHDFLAADEKVKSEMIYSYTEKTKNSRERNARGRNSNRRGNIRKPRGKKSSDT
jgi:poly(A) polymerase